MITKLDKNKERKRRHERVRGKLIGTAERPRLSIYRSLNQIYAQIIDDAKGITLVSANTAENGLANDLAGKTKVEQSFIIGQTLADRAKKKDIKSVIFDRSGYIYTGRIKKVADGARANGLEF